MHTKSKRQQEIEARLEELDEQRRAAKEEGAKLVQELHSLLAEEQAAEWDVTVEQYAAAKERAYPDRAPRRELEAAEERLARLNARAEDRRKTDEVRENARTAAQAVQESIAELQAAVKEAQGRRVSLLLALKQARQARRLEEKNAQHATAQPAPVRARVKKGGD